MESSDVQSALPFPLLGQWFISQQNNACVERFGFDQLEPCCDSVFKKTLPLTQHNWVDQKAIFINEIMLCQRLHKNTTPSNQDSLTRLLLQLGNLFCNGTVDLM